MTTPLPPLPNGYTNPFGMNMPWSPYQLEALHKWEAEVRAAQAPLLQEIERLKAGGCARDQGLTQYCAEAQAAQTRLAAAEALLKACRRFLVDSGYEHTLARIDAFLKEQK